MVVMWTSPASGSETLDVAVSGTIRPEFIWRVQPQQRCQLNLLKPSGFFTYHQV
jgi:hypothetical protein